MGAVRWLTVGGRQGEHPVAEQVIVVGSTYERRPVRELHGLFNNERGFRSDRISGVLDRQRGVVRWVVGGWDVARDGVTGQFDLVDVIDARVAICIGVDQIRERRGPVGAGDGELRGGAAVLVRRCDEGPARDGVAARDRVVQSVNDGLLY